MLSECSLLAEGHFAGLSSESVRGGFTAFLYTALTVTKTGPMQWRTALRRTIRFLASTLAWSLFPNMLSSSPGYPARRLTPPLMLPLGRSVCLQSPLSSFHARHPADCPSC